MLMSRSHILLSVELFPWVLNILTDDIYIHFEAKPSSLKAQKKQNKKTNPRDVLKSDSWFGSILENPFSRFLVQIEIINYSS